MRLQFLTVLALAALPVLAERHPFERYQSLVDRQMFGQPPQGFDPTKPPSEVAKMQSAKELKEKQEQLKSAIHFSAINVSADGEVEVGFTDKSNPQDPKHYFVRKGSMAGKWLVQEADAELATMTLVKDGVSVELTLGQDSATGAGTTKLVDASAPQQPAAASSSSSGAARTISSGAARTILFDRGGHKSNRLKDREERERLAEELRKRDEENRKRDEERKREMDEMRRKFQEQKEALERERQLRESKSAAAGSGAAENAGAAVEGADDESNADQ